MDLSIIKQILRLAGINGLVVRFDDRNRQIIATFTKNSQARIEFIPFTAIKEFFTDIPRHATRARIQPHSPALLEDSLPVGH